MEIIKGKILIFDKMAVSPKKDSFTEKIYTSRWLKLSQTSTFFQHYLAKVYI